MRWMRLIGVDIRTPYPWVAAYGPHIFVGGLIGCVIMFWLLFRVQTAAGRSTVSK